MQPFLFRPPASTDLTVNGISLAKNPDSTAVSVTVPTLQSLFLNFLTFYISFNCLMGFLAAISGRIPPFFPGGVC